jgi:hypothetical protein
MFLAKANDASVPPQRFQRDSRSVSSFGTDDEQRGSIGKTIVVENRLLPFEPHREKPARQVRRTTAQHAYRVNLILREAAADQVCNRGGYIEWIPKDSGQCGPSGVAFKGQHGHVRRKLLEDLLGGRTISTQASTHHGKQIRGRHQRQRTLISDHCRGY